MLVIKVYHVLYTYKCKHPIVLFLFSKKRLTLVRSSVSSKDNQKIAYLVTMLLRKYRLVI